MPFFPLHPKIVHFPIALTMVGVITVIAGMVWQRERWLGYGRLSLIMGWVGAILAGLSGLVDQNRAPDTPAVANLLNQHITAGLALIVVVGLAIYWPLRRKAQLTNLRQGWMYVLLLLAGIMLVMVNGWLGGKLVYTLGVGVR